MLSEKLHSQSANYKMRNKFDQYYTPNRYVKSLLDHLEFPLSGTIFEPCCGQDAISNELKSRGFTVITNDIDPLNNADYHYDLSIPLSWQLLNNEFDCDFIVTNPPFNLAVEIIPQCYAKARKGVIALLRVSFIEPCNNRQDFLVENPPNQIYSTKRINFLGGKKTDKVNTIWCIWLKDENSKQMIKRPIDFLLD